MTENESSSNSRAPKRLIIVKVPLGYTPEVPEADFGRIKPPYLELLENKERVKDALRDQDYDVDLIVHPNPPKEGVRRDRSSLHRQKPGARSSSSRLITTTDVSSRLHIPKHQSDSDEPASARSDHSRKSDRSTRSDRSDRSDRSNRSTRSDRSDRSDRSVVSVRSVRSDSSLDEYHKRVHKGYRDELIEQDRERRERERIRREQYKHESNSDDSGTESDRSAQRSDHSREERSSASRMSRMMEGGVHGSSSSSSRFSRYVMQGGDRSNLAPRIVYDRHRSSTSSSSSPSHHHRSESFGSVGVGGSTSSSSRELPSLPSLSQIQDSQHSSHARRVEQEQSKEQNTEKERTNLLMKLYRLKMAFPDGDIPPYSETTDTDTLRKIFEQTRRKLHVNKDTEQYKQWSAMAHMALEYILVNLIKMKTARGLAEHHMRTAEKYNELLMELSDQQYNSGPSSWPVHWRLAGMVLFESAVFIGGNMLMNKLAGNMQNMFNNMGSTGSSNPSRPTGGGNSPAPPTMSPPPSMSSSFSSFGTNPIPVNDSGYGVHGPGQSGINPSANLTMEGPPVMLPTPTPVSKMSGPKLDLNPDKRKSD